MKIRIKGRRDRIITPENELQIKQFLLDKYSPCTIVKCYDYKGELMDTLTIDALYGEKQDN